MYWAGTILGAVLGVLLAFVQQHWGVVKIPGGSIFEAYPVSLSIADVAVVIVIVMAMGATVSTLTVRSRFR